MYTSANYSKTVHLVSSTMNHMIATWHLWLGDYNTWEVVVKFTDNEKTENN